MAVFAVVTEGVVQNIVEAEDSFPLQLMFEDSSIIEVTEATGNANIGCEVLDGKFVPLKPIFDSWVLDKKTLTWNAPIKKPTSKNLHFWNEDTLSWVEIDPLTIIDVTP